MFAITLVDKYGDDYEQTFEDINDIRAQIDKLDACLEDVSGAAYSRLSHTIIELQDFLSSIEQ